MNSVKASHPPSINSILIVSPSTSMPAFKQCCFLQDFRPQIYTHSVLSTCPFDRDSSVVIAARYGLDGPDLESRWGTRFSTPIQIGPGPHPASYTTGTGSFPGVKRPGRGVDHPYPSSAEANERVELYLYSPLDLRGLFQGELYLYL